MLRVLVPLVVLLAPIAGHAAPFSVRFEGEVTSILDSLGMLEDLAVGDPFSLVLYLDDSVAPSLDSEFPPGCNGPIDECAVYEFRDFPMTGFEMRAGARFWNRDSVTPSAFPLAVRISNFSVPEEFSIGGEDSYSVRYTGSRETIGGVDITQMAMGGFVALADPFDILGEAPALLESTDVREVPDISQLAMVPDMVLAWNEFGLTLRREFRPRVPLFDETGKFIGFSPEQRLTSRFDARVTAAALVPEPTAVALLGFGLGGLLAGRRRSLRAGPWIDRRCLGWYGLWAWFW